jgi:hypothetical protein
MTFHSRGVRSDLGITSRYVHLNLSRRHEHLTGNGRNGREHTQNDRQTYLTELLLLPYFGYPYLQPACSMLRAIRFSPHVPVVSNACLSRYSLLSVVHRVCCGSFERENMQGSPVRAFATPFVPSSNIVSRVFGDFSCKLAVYA